MGCADVASERIGRIRSRYLGGLPVISIDRAKFYTESWRATEAGGLPAGVRVALAMKNVYENMRMNVDSDDHIAGTWTENFSGIPIDIERGLFNGVLEIELEKKDMLLFQLKSGIKMASFMLRKYDPATLYKNVRRATASGVAMPAMGLETISERRVNPCRIREKDKAVLQRDLLPYWKGKTVADMLVRDLTRAKVMDREVREFTESLSAPPSRPDTIISYAAAIGTWQGHLILDHDTPLKKGLHAMRQDILDCMENCQAEDQERMDFLRSAETAIDGVIIYARRLDEKIRNELSSVSDAAQRKTLGQMLSVCEKVPLFPAESFREAVQSYWTVKTAVELAVPFNVHAPGRLDQYLFEYYERDIASGAITREDARELLEELFLKIMSHNMRPNSNFSGEFSQRYEGSEPVTLGGVARDGKDAVNELTYVMLEAAERSCASLNFVVRINAVSPEMLLETVAGMHYRGVSSVSIMNDEVSIRAMEKRGFTSEDARDYAITGCVDMVAPGKTGGESFSAVLLCRVLDATLRNGDTRTLLGDLKGVGLKTGNPERFKTFEQFINAYIAQAAHMMKKIAGATHVRDALYAEYMPSPHISAFMKGCVENGKDVTRGGAMYNIEGILFMSSIANVVDSLYVIKKLIFDGRRFNFSQLMAAVDDDFKGHERILDAINSLEGKWGNGDPESDAIAREVTTRLFEETYKYETYKGGIFAPFINSMTAHTFDGRISMATPDGRRAGRPYASSCNPYNVERRGLTGVLRSVAALDFEHVLGCAVNVRLHPSSIGKTSEAREKWLSLIRTYFALGGEQLQPTVVSTKTLRAAQMNPSDYGNVIVKVGGYSAYFVDLGREIQNEIISRTEHSVS